MRWDVDVLVPSLVPSLQRFFRGKVLSTGIPFTRQHELLNVRNTVWRTLRRLGPATWRAHRTQPRKKAMRSSRAVQKRPVKKIVDRDKKKTLQKLRFYTAIVKEIAKLVMTPPSDSNTPTCDQLPTSPRRVHLPSPLSITVSSEYSCSITMAEPAHQFSSIPNHSWPNCYPSPPTEDQSNEQQIISEILLNSPTSSIDAMNDLTTDAAEPQLLSPGAADTSAAFLYPQIGKPTSTKCERFMEFMRIQKQRRIRPRTMLEARAGALVGRPRSAGYGIGAGAGVPLPYLRSPPRQRAERGFLAPYEK
ncbi:hypothetical protein BC830DRAFT_1077519 [Chytriomyces sp. MP71]|nr:hypothetical protein BC830DRAFT_1077519 [Chytriomyces sp. MP71]